MTAVVAALFLGSAEPRAAVEAMGCAGDGAGKPICVKVTGLAQSSRTPVGGPEHYLTHDVEVYYNPGSTSTLSNLKVTIEWSDPGSAEPTSPTSAFRPLFSDSTDADDPYYCTQPDLSKPMLTCTTPKSLRAGESFTFGPLVFRTATNLAVPASETKVTVSASAKEQAPPPKKGTDNVAFVNVSNSTTYEGSPDLDLSQAGDGLSTTLATAQTGAQYSRLPIPASGGDRALYRLEEGDCPTGFTCLSGSQGVTTTAPGLEPVNLWITYTGPAPGVTENSLVVLHDRANDFPDLGPITIDSDCGTTLFSGVEPDTIPCRTVDITHLPGGIVRIDVDVWDLENGSWGFG